MLQAATGPARKARVSKLRKLDAPVEGWSSQYPISNAPAKTALVMDNWFPEADGIRVRRGITTQSTGLGGAVNSLMAYNSQTGAYKLFGAAGGNVFDCTASGAVGAAALSGKTNANWQQTMFSTPGGQFLMICNGADGVYSFDGTTWVNQTAAITGTAGAVNSFIHVCQHKGRIWFTPDNSTTLWYLGVQAINGAATAFPVGAFFNMGGKILACATWSSPASQLLDDYLVILSTEGEALIYGGTDPTSASTWGLKYRVFVGKPMSNRCFMNIGGDLIIMSELGLVALSKILEIDPAVFADRALTKNVRTAYKDAVQASRGAFGWCMTSLPQSNMGIVNIPAGGTNPIQQFALNTVTGAWGRFTGWNALSWQYLNGAIYYGDGNGNVFRAEYGANDNGTPIYATVIPAFSDMGRPGTQKYVTYVKPTYNSDSVQNYQIGIGTDYKIPTLASSGVTVSTGLFTWGSSIWGGGDIWRAANVSAAWNGSSNIGVMISPVMAMNFDGTSAGPSFNYKLYSFDVLYEDGGVF